MRKPAGSMIAASAPRQAQVRMIAPAFWAISGSKSARRTGRVGSFIRLRAKAPAKRRKRLNFEGPRICPRYGHRKGSVRKAAQSLTGAPAPLDTTPSAAPGLAQPNLDGRTGRRDRPDGVRL